MLSSASDKANLFAENFSKRSYLDDSGISLPVLPSRTNLKLHISVSPKIIKKVIMILDLSKTSGPDCIPVVVLKNCEPELSYILAKPFNKSLKESCFPDCWKVSSMFLVFKNVGENSTAKNYCPASLLSVVSKVFEKLVNVGLLMKILYKNIQLMLEFLKGPVLVLHFSCCILMTFLMVSSVIFLSMLIILLSILTVIRHLICGNNFNWLLNLNLIYETLWTGVRCGLLISMLEKLSWFRLTGQITMVLLM